MSTRLTLLATSPHYPEHRRSRRRRTRRIWYGRMLANVACNKPPFKDSNIPPRNPLRADLKRKPNFHSNRINHRTMTYSHPALSLPTG